MAQDWITSVVLIQAVHAKLMKNYNKFQFDSVKLLLNYLKIANRIASHNTIFMKGTER